MPSRPHAHLMLPSPLGLLEYDVLEDAVFLGPGGRGNLKAGPSPFKGALVALTRVGDGYVARPLPGAEQPLVNGEAVDEQVLADGDRIRVGDQVAMFRTERGLMTAPRAPAAAPPVERPPPPSRRPARRAGNPAVTITVLAGLAIVLAATYRAVSHLKAIQGARVTHGDFPEIGKRTDLKPTRASRELAELHEHELRNAGQYENLVQRYRAFQRAFPDTRESRSAEESVRELTRRWGEQERATLDEKVKALVSAHQFASALRSVREFEGRFGTTEAAEGLEGLRQEVRAEARKALDALVTQVGPLITPKPRQAHRMLIGVSNRFPADMSSEVVVLLERCIERMMAISAKQRRERPERDPPRKGGDPQLPPIPGEDPTPVKPPTPVDPPGRGGGETEARQAWAAARRDLQAGKYPEALRGYTAVVQQYGNTTLYRDNKARIAAGRRAAKVGALGPEGLVNVPVTTKRGRLEMEYHLNDEQVFDEDFTVEQPFSTEMPVQVKWKRGAVLMEKGSGLFHRLVFLPDVRIEADVDVQQPHDFGLLAVEDSDRFRAVLFNVANTKFMLKKGDNRKPNPGHVLWYIGEGVWAAADKDAHGFIKIAERNRSKLESGDRIKLEFERKKDKAAGGFQGKSDGVHLEGAVKGDDGSTMGSARVGLFTNSGIVVVRAVRISGRVDMEWFRKELEFLVASDPGPDPDDGN